MPLTSLEEQKRLEEQRRARERLLAVFPTQPSASSNGPANFAKLKALTAPDKWYSGDVPKTSEAIARMYTLFGDDEQKFNSAYSLLQKEQSTAGSLFYDPYTRPTNQVIFSELNKLGIDTSNVNADWFKEHEPLMQGLQRGIDGSPVKGKTKQSKAAYYLYKLSQDESNTQLVEQQMEGVKRDIAYWVSRSDLNLSDEEILAKINIPQNYKALAEIDNSRKTGSLYELNRPVEYSQDALLGAIWSARNGKSTGSLMADAVQYQLGNGVKYKDNPAIRSRRDPTSEYYNPYLLGSTLDEEAAYFGVPSFNRDWLNKNLNAIMGSNDETAKKYVQNVYDAVEATEEVQSELSEFTSNFERIGFDMIVKRAMRDKLPAKDAVLQYIENAGLDKLRSLSESLDRRQPLKLAQGVNFDLNYITSLVDKEIQARTLREADSKAASEKEKQDALKENGDLTGADIVPPSKVDKTWQVTLFESTVPWLIDTDIFGTIEEEPVIKPGSKLGKLASAGATDFSYTDSRKPLQQGYDPITGTSTGLKSTVETDGRGGGFYAERESPAIRTINEKIVQKQAELDELTAKAQTISLADAAMSNNEDLNRILTLQGEIAALKKEAENTFLSELYAEQKTLKVPDGYVSSNKSPLTQYLKTKQELMSLYNATEEEWPKLAEQIRQIKYPLPLGEGYSSLSQKQIDEIMYTLMTPEEIDRYNVIWDERGEKEAGLYFDGLKKERLNEEYRKKFVAEAEEFAEKSPVLSSVVSSVTKVTTDPLETARIVVEKILGKDIAKNDVRLTSAAVSSAIRSTVSKDFSPFAKWAYDTVMGISDNIINRGMFGTMSLLTMGLSAANSKMEQVMASGGTSDQAFILGALTFLIEGATENAQMEVLTKWMKPLNGKNAVTVIKNLLVNGLMSGIPEGAEEGMSGILDIVSDIAVRGEQSDFMKQYAAIKASYIANGYSDADAHQMAAKDTVNASGIDVLKQMASGGVSGFFFGDVFTLANRYHASINGKAANNTEAEINNPHTQIEKQELATAMIQQDLDGNNPPEVLARHSQQAMEVFGIDPAIVKEMGTRILGMKNATLFDVLERFKSPPKKFSMVRSLESVTKSLEKQDPITRAKSIGSLAKLNLLANTLKPQSAEANQKVEDALVTSINDLVAKQSELQTKMDAAKPAETKLPSYDASFSLQRWGQKGLVYINNLLTSGNQLAQEIAVKLQSMPQYAESVIVAETNMNSLNTTPEMMEKQTQAFARDMNEPDIVQNAEERAENQQVEIVKNEILSGLDVSPEVKAVETAQEEAAVFAKEVENANMELQAASEASDAAMEAAYADPMNKDAWKAADDAVDAVIKAKDNLTKIQENQEKSANKAAKLQSELDAKVQEAQRAAEEQAKATVKASKPAKIETQLDSTQPETMEAKIVKTIETQFADRSPEDIAKAKALALEKYKAMKGVNAPVFNEQSAEFVKKAEAKFGIRFISDDTLKGSEEAYYDKATKTIHLNPQATQGDALTSVAMHELTHAAQSSDWYSQYKDLVLKMAYGDINDNAQFQRDIDAKIARYANDGKTLSVDDAIAEIVAQQSRKVIFADAESVNKLVAENPTLAKRIYEAITRVLRELFGNDRQNDLYKAQSLLKRALTEQAGKVSSPVQDKAGAYPKGKGGVIYTAGNDAVEFVYAAVPASSLVVSHDTNFNENPNFPPELQPRDRYKASYRDQVTRISDELNFDRMADSPEVTSGAPIIGADMVVEVGNGRTMSLMLARQGNKQTAKQYTARLRERAAEFGLRPEDIKDDSVLVRIRTTDVDRAAFASKGNDPVTSTYSPSESAVNDAAKITPDMLNKVRVNSSGEIDEGNGFVADFVQALPESERAGVLTEDGSLSQMGRLRIRNALFQRAYNDMQMTAQLSEETDGTVKRVISAMTNVSPKVAKLNQMMADGQLNDLGVAPAIVEAYNRTKTVRASGLELEEYLSQVKMIEDPAAVRLLLETFDKYKGSAVKITGALEAVLNQVVASGDSRQAVMPGLEVAARPSTESVIRSGLEAFEREQNAQQKMFSLTDSDDADIDKILNQLISQYGAIPQGENATNTTALPKETSPGKKTSLFARTAVESGQFNEAQMSEFKKLFVAGEFSHEPITDVKALAYVDSLEKNQGIAGLQQEWDKAGDNPGKYDMAVGLRLFQRYSQANDTANTMKTLAELVAEGTRAGQVEQSLRLLKKSMTGAMSLYAAQRQINWLNKKYKTGDIKLNQDLFQEYLNAKTDEERNEVGKKIQMDIGQQIPTNWRKKLTTWRMLAMLFNPLTHVRNIVGNLSFIPLIKQKNIIAAGLESVFNTKRTKSARLDHDLLRAAWNDANANKDEITSGGKYNPTVGAEEYAKKFGDSWAGKALEKLANFTFKALEFEDWLALRHHYAASLAGYLQANGLNLATADDSTLAEARQYAVDEAKKATYRDRSVIAEWLVQGAQSSVLLEVPIEGAMPFKKTPFNIAKRSFEYSPVGLIESVFHGSIQLANAAKNVRKAEAAVRNEENATTKNQLKVAQDQLSNAWVKSIDRFSAGVSGSIVAGLGAAMSALGWIRVGFRDKDKEDEFLSMTGTQENAFEIEIFGYKISATIGWMVPTAVPLLVGATIQQMATSETPEGGFTLENILTAIGRILEPVWELTMFQGFNRAAEAAAYDQQNFIVAFLLNSASNLVNQMLPTIAGTVSRIADPVRRKNYKDKNAAIPSAGQTLLDSVLAKFAPKLREPYLDIWGEEQREDSLPARAVQNLLLPGYVREIEPDAVNDMLLEIYHETGDSNVLPAIPSKYFYISGKRIDLTGPQYTAYSKAYGKTMRAAFESLSNNEEYQSMGWQAKAQVLAKTIDYAALYGKFSIAPDYAVKDEVKEAVASNTLGQFVINEVKGNLRNEERSVLRDEAVKSVAGGDYESLMELYGAMTLWYEEQYPDKMNVEADVNRYLNEKFKPMFEKAYKADDMEGMSEIMDTLSYVGIDAYNWFAELEEKEHD